MTTNNIIQYMRNPGQLNEETLGRLKEITEEYPYFQTARLLLLKNKFLLNNPEWQSEVESASAYVPDRRVLYNLLYPLTETEDYIEPEQIPENETRPEDAEAEIEIQEPAVPAENEKPRTLRDNISNLLTLQMEELELVDPDEAELVPEISIDVEKTYGQPVEDQSDFFQLETEAVPPEEVPEKKDNCNELIEKFITTSPKIEAPRIDKPQVDISEDSVKEHDGIFTDTLAKIYVKQGYYSKAIFAYEKLILKYPEKSDYFAGQIEAIKKLTNKQ